MKTDKCPCINKFDAANIRSALTTSREIYRHIIKTLTIDISSPEYVVLEEKANKFNALIYQLDSVICKEDTGKMKKGEFKYMTPEQIASLPKEKRIMIAKAIAGTVSK